MADKKNSALTKAADEFAALTGRLIKSKLLSETIALEGEYKDDLSSGDDQLDVPSFLKGPAPNNPMKRKPEEKSDDTPVSEKVLSQLQCVAILNEIQDRGYVRSQTKRIDETTRRYTFVNTAGTIEIRIKQVSEGFRVIGADHILSKKKR